MMKSGTYGYCPEGGAVCFENVIYGRTVYFCKIFTSFTRSDLEEIQPPLIDIKGTISAEEVTNVSELPRGSCTGTLIPESGKEVLHMFCSLLIFSLKLGSTQGTLGSY